VENSLLECERSKFSAKWTGIRSKSAESNCDIICLHKTKREIFDHVYIKKFFTSQFDCFEYLPSVGDSGGTIIIWKSSKFMGSVGVSYPRYCGSLIMAQKSRYGRFPPAANGWGNKHTILDMSPPLLAKEEGTPI
jgi:hypothetical protein